MVSVPSKVRAARSASPLVRALRGGGSWLVPVVGGRLRVPLLLLGLLLPLRIGVLLVLLVLAHELLRIAPEERVDHDVPLVLARQGAAEVLHLTGQQPVEQRDGLLALVVRRDGDVD